MSDRYGDFVQSSIGKKVAKNLGLPMPVELDRFDSGQPLVRGSVLVGRANGDDKSVSESIARILSDVHAEVFVNSRDDIKDALADAGVEAKANTGGDDKFKVLVFDASNISNADQLKEVYEFFHAVARRVERSGRVIIVGRTPGKYD